MNALHVYVVEYKRKLGDVLPKVRGGDGEEDLVSLLVDYTKSAFYYDTAQQFLYEREKVRM